MRWSRTASTARPSERSEKKRPISDTVGHIFPSVTTGIEIHHLALHDRMSQSQTADFFVDGFHAQTVYENIGTGIITFDDHVKNQL
jgi:hypothetical protein